MKKIFSAFLLAAALLTTACGGTVTVEADTHGVRVTATRAGGTLHWKGADYAIPENEPLIIMA